MDISRVLGTAAGVALFIPLLAGCGGTAPPVVVRLPTLAATADASALRSVPFGSPTPTASPVATLPTITPLPTATPLIPSATPGPTPVALATPTADPARQINGIPFEQIAVIPPNVAEHVAQIAKQGQELGRDPHTFSKIGDSAVLIESNLTRFDNGPLDLGPYSFLEPTISYFAQSWERYGAGARVSLTAIGTLDPMWANPAYCSPGENLLACEIRLNNPSILLIRLGTNDGSADLYHTYMSQIIEYALDNGIVPILGTKADRFEGDDSINEATRQLAAAYRVPLWDFDAVAATLPNRGLTDDHAHLSVYRRNDYTDPETYQRGYPMSDLSALVALDAVREIMFPDASAVESSEP
ncbi:MAG: hypothetical protein R3C43_04830 [Chloroflexota bacterium]